MAGPFFSEVLLLDQTQIIIVYLIVQFIAFGGARLAGYLCGRIGQKNTLVFTILLFWVVLRWKRVALTALKMHHGIKRRRSQKLEGEVMSKLKTTKLVTMISVISVNSALVTMFSKKM